MKERIEAANKGMIFPFKGKSRRKRRTFLSIQKEMEQAMWQDASWRLYVFFMKFFKYHPPGIARHVLSKMLKLAADYRKEG